MLLWKSSRHRFQRVLWVSLLLLGTLLPALARASSKTGKWIATWACAPQLCEPQNLPPKPGFEDCTLRQYVRVSIGGKTIKVRFSNEFGGGPLTILGAEVAPAMAGGSIQPDSGKALAFGGQPSVVVPAGAQALSDPLDFRLDPLARVALTLRLKGVPKNVTAHPGSRTTSYLVQGDYFEASDFNAPVTVDHWYFITGIEVKAPKSCAAVAVLGDSLTDGRGSTTNQDGRWPDFLSRRLQSVKPKTCVAVLNLGIGGNRLLRDGLGPNALSRLDRDVIHQPGVKWLIVLEGINDLGTAEADRKSGKPAVTAKDLITGYEQIIGRAHAADIRVYGATLTPFEGAFYYSPRGEADRQAVNEWIRNSGAFDAVIDFDEALRDPNHPSSLLPSVDSGDHLHLNPAGYQTMAQTVNLRLLRRRKP